MIFSVPVAWLVNSSLLSHNISDKAISRQAVTHRKCCACSRHMEWQYGCKYRGISTKRIGVITESCWWNAACVFPVLTCPSHGKIYLLSQLERDQITHCGPDRPRLAKLWMLFFFLCVYYLYHSALLDSVHFLLSANTNRHLPPDLLHSVSAWFWH